MKCDRWTGRTKSLFNGAIILIALLLVVGCTKTTSLSEEVELSPGEIIVVTRRYAYERSCEGFQCGWAVTSNSLEKGGLISGTWFGDRSRTPMLLTRAKSGDIVLVDIRGYCDGPMYQQYVLKGESWTPVPLDLEFHHRDRNVLFGDSNAPVPAPVTIAAKKRILAQPGHKSYAQRIAPNARGNC